MNKSAWILPGLIACAFTFQCGGSTNAAQSPTPDKRETIVLSGRVEVNQGGIDAQALLNNSAEIAAGEGATTMQVLAADAAAEGDRVGGFVNVAKNTCLVAYAHGTSDVEDLDILTFDDNGASLTADQAISSSPAIVLCPPHPERVYVAARVASGHGLVAVGVHAVEPNKAAAVAIRLGARMSSREGDIMTQEAWPGLAKRVAQRREELAGRWMELRRLSVPISPRTASYLSVPLAANRCLDVLVMPNEEAVGLHVTVADDDGTIIARGADRGEDRTALVCSPVDTTMTVGIRPRRGHGLAAVVLSQSEAGAESELAVRPDARRVGPMQPIEDVQKQTAAALAKLPQARRVGQGPIEVGNTVLHHHRLPSGCTRFDIMAGKPIASIRATLWGGDTLLSQAEGGEQITLFGCANKPQDIDLEVEGQGRPGQHIVEARTDARAPAPLRDNPLAGGRLLARANAAGRVVTASDLQQLRAIDVTSSKRASWNLTVPGGSCQQLVAALGAGATGIVMQAVDSASDRVLAMGHGGSVVSLNVCAEDATLRANIRLAVTAGEGKAVVAVVE